MAAGLDGADGGGGDGGEFCWGERLHGILMLLPIGRPLRPDSACLHVRPGNVQQGTLDFMDDDVHINDGGAAGVFQGDVAI